MTDEGSRFATSDTGPKRIAPVALRLVAAVAIGAALWLLGGLWWRGPNQTEQLLVSKGFHLAPRLQDPDRIGECYYRDGAVFDAEALAAIARLSDVRILSLRGAPIGDQELRALTRLSHLQHLDLRGTQVTLQGLASLREVESLREIAFAGDEETISRWAARPPLTQVKRLVLTGPATKADPKLRAANPQLEIVRDDRVDESTPGEYAVWKWIERLGPDNGHTYEVRNKRIWRISLRLPRLTQEVIGKLRDCPNVESLALRIGRETRVDEADLALPALQHLSLSGSGVDNGTLSLFRNSSRLKTLSLDGTSVSDDALRHFADLQHLTLLRLWKNQLTSRCLEHVPTAALRTVDLRGPSFALTEIPWHRFSRVTHITLRATGLTDASLHGIDRAPNIQMLDISYNDITSAALEHLAELPNLKTLLIYDAPFAWEDVPALRRLPALRELYLAHSPLTANAAAMARLKREMPQLTNLSSD